MLTFGHVPQMVLVNAVVANRLFATLLVNSHFSVVFLQSNFLPLYALTFPPLIGHRRLFPPYYAARYFVC